MREAVLELRRSKGMVVDPGDPDSVSAGSFFTNPILDPEAFAALETRAAERLGPDARPPPVPRARRPRQDVGGLAGSSEPASGADTERARCDCLDKHTLAITNRGGGTAAELVALARELRRACARLSA